MTNDIITVIANLALTLSFIIALVFGVAQMKAAKRDRQERLTLETLRNFQTHEFALLINRINHREMPQNQKQLNALPANEQVDIIHYAQMMEALGILVAEKFIDLDLVDKILGSLVTTTWEKYKPAFTDMRVSTPDPFLGEYFQWLAERIDERLKLNPRVPFYKTSDPL